MKDLWETKQILNRTDAAVLVIDSTAGITKADRQLIDIFAEKEIPYLIALNKADLLPENGCAATAAAEAAAACSDCRIPPSADQFIPVSAAFNTGISYLKECIARLTASEESQRRIVGDLGPAHRAPAVGHPQAVAPAQTQHADGMLRLLFAEQIASGSRVQIGGIK